MAYYNETPANVTPPRSNASPASAAAAAVNARTSNATPSPTQAVRSTGTPSSSTQRNTVQQGSISVSGGVAAPSGAASAAQGSSVSAQQRGGVTSSGSAAPMSTSTGSSAAPGTYNIGSQTGANVYEDMLAGRTQTFTAGDGSVWTRNADGSISIQHQGKTLTPVLTYIGNTTSQSSAPRAATGQYNIGSAYGNQIYNELLNGDRTTFTGSDGSVWTRNPDGTISIQHQGNILTPNVTYQAPTRTYQGSITRKNGSVLPNVTITTDQYGNFVDALLPNGQRFSAGDYLDVNGVTYVYDDVDGKWYDNGTYQQILQDRNQAVQVPQYDPNIWSSYLDYLWEYYPEEYAREMERQQSMYDDLQAQLEAANKAGTELGKLQLMQSYNNAVRDYTDQAAEAYLQKMQNQDNLAMRLAAAGDMGGIGQKQYADEAASYDQQLMNIQLEQLSLKQNVESQIAQLEAQGQYELANTLAELGQAQINALQEQYEYYHNMLYNMASANDELTTERSRYAIQDAMNKLQLGIFTPEDAEALGIPAEDAQRVANYYSQMADIDLATAQAGLEKTLAQLAGRSTGGSSGSGSGSGGSGGSNSSVFGNMTAGSLADLSSQLYKYAYDADGNPYIDSYGSVPVLRADGTMGYAQANAAGDGLIMTDGSSFRPGDRVNAGGVIYIYQDGGFDPQRPGGYQHDSRNYTESVTSPNATVNWPVMLKSVAR